MLRKDRFDAVIIETPGLADPAPVAQTFFMDDAPRAQLRLDAIVTVIDAKHVLTHLDEVKPDGVEEPMRRGDRVRRPDRPRRARVRPGSRTCGRPEFLDPNGEHQHDQSVSSVGIDVQGTVDVEKLDEWLSRLLGERGQDLFRGMGVLSLAGNDRPLRVPRCAHAARR